MGDYQSLKSNIFKRENTSNMRYNDGSENYIDSIFSDESIIYDNKYPIELSMYIKDFSSKYNLSVRRLNIIEAFIELVKDRKNALELGAGTGIITGILSHYFENVDAVEGDFYRANIISKRLRNIDNVKIYIDDLLDFPYKNNYYNLVTMIGVLEYIPFYKDMKSVETVLSKVRDSLDQNGIFLLAIENKFGAKYFTGCKEDHNAMLFTNLIGYPFKSPLTFSRREIETLLKNAGFQNIKFYFAFPDYKFADLIVKECDEFFELKPSGILLQNFNAELGRIFLFSDVLFVENIIRSGEISTFANSFVVLASRSKNVNLNTHWIIKRFFNQILEDPRIHNVMEVIKEKDSHEFKVVKKPLEIAGGVKKVKKSKLIFNLDNYESRYIQGENLFIRSLKFVFSYYLYNNIDGLNNLIELFSTVNNFILSEFSTGKTDKYGFPLVNGIIDCILWNMIEKDGQIYFVDRKWLYEEELPIDFILSRSVDLIYVMCRPYINMDEYTFHHNILSNIYNKYNYSRFNLFKRKHNEFLSLVKLR